MREPTADEIGRLEKHIEQTAAAERSKFELADSEPDLHTCRKCGEEKVAADFVPDKRLEHGIKTVCRECFDKARSASRKRKSEPEPEEDDVEWDTQAVPRFGFRARVDRDTDSLVISQPSDDGEAVIILGRAETQQLVDAVAEWLGSE